MGSVGQSGRINGVVHSFADQLEYSARLSDEPSWVAFYQRLWPEMVASVRVDVGGDAQRDGIDRIVHLASGRQFAIDEKKRTKYYRDIALEEWSVFYSEGDQRNKIGWALDARKRCDFIAYAIVPAQKCYLLPFELLRQAFMARRSDWVRRFRIPPTPNAGYITLNVAVPPGELKTALWEQMHRRFGKSDLPLPTPTTTGLQIEFGWGS